MDILELSERIITEVRTSPKATGAYLTREEADAVASCPDLDELCDAADHI